MLSKINSAAFAQSLQKQTGAIIAKNLTFAFGTYNNEPSRSSAIDARLSSLGGTELETAIKNAQDIITGLEKIKTDHTNLPSSKFIPVDNYIANLQAFVTAGKEKELMDQLPQIFSNKSTGAAVSHFFKSDDTTLQELNIWCYRVLQIMPINDPRRENIEKLKHNLGTIMDNRDKPHTVSNQKLEVARILESIIPSKLMDKVLKAIKVDKEDLKAYKELKADVQQELTSIRPT